MVIDVNDNVPRIEIPENCATVSEFHDIKDNIAIIKVRDDDDSKSPNGRTALKILSGNEKGK